MKRSGTTEALNGRLEIRLAKGLLQELRVHADRRGVELSEWARTALQEKLIKDRLHAKWMEERRALDKLKKAIEQMPLSVHLKRDGQMVYANDKASLNGTDKAKNS